MSLIDDLSRALKPHTAHIADTASYHLQEISETLREIRRQGDLGKPDTGDVFKFFIFKGEIKGKIELGELCNTNGEPTLGEDWLVQSIAINGGPSKSPAFAIRTNTGRLIVGVVKEGTASEHVGGDVIIKQGEQLFFEPAEAGKFDFTLTVVQRKYPRQEPDATGGISQELYTPHQPAVEVERTLQQPAYDPSNSPV